MGAPAGGEIAIYNGAIKRLEYRAALMLDYPALTAVFEEDFDGSWDAYRFATSYFGGRPSIAGSSAFIQLYGSTCREFIILRPTAFPRDLTKKFTLTWHHKFPAPDPVYSAIVILGTIDTEFGADGDPWHIIQRGSLHTDVGHVGNTFYGVGGEVQVEATSETYDGAMHKYQAIYDPAAAAKLVLKVDDVAIYGVASDIFGNNSSTNSAPRPYYLMFGMMLPKEDDSAYETTLLNGGTLGAPTPLPIIEIADIKVECDSYETRTYPGWTTTNLGHTIDTAADGERYTENGYTWAKLPRSQMKALTTHVGRLLNTPNDDASVELLAPKASDMTGTPDLFGADLSVSRPLVIDSRVGSESAWADWRRHICAILDAKEKQLVPFTLTGRDRPSVKLDSFFPVGYFGVEPDGDQEGVADGRKGLLLAGLNGDSEPGIFEDVLAITDALYGDPLGVTLAIIRKIAQAPKLLGSGGDALGSVLQQWGDRAVQELYRIYETSGDPQYGQFRSNLWTMSGTSVYTFRGSGETNPNISSEGVRLTGSARLGTGQAQYRNDSPVVPLEGLTDELIPTLGMFPTAQYPLTDRELPDSYGPFADEAVSSLLPLRAADDSVMGGGVAMWRYRMENANRRQIEFSVQLHNWMQPAMIFKLKDAATGITDAETWAIDNVELAIAAGSLHARIQATSTDWLRAIRETM